MAKERGLTRSRQRVDRARRRRSYPQPYYGYQELQAMREEARRRRRKLLVRASLIVPPLVAVVVVAALSISAVWGPGDDTAGTRTSGSTPVGPVVPTSRFVNDEGSYAFRHPTGWNVTPLGTRTELTDPSGDVSLWIDVVADGEGLEVLTATLPTLTSSWSQVKTEGPILRHVDGRPAVSVGGTGVAGGRLIRFLAIVVDGADRNAMIFVTVPQERDALTVTPQIDATVSSFELLSGG
jgi:hypothetical protein